MSLNYSYNKLFAYIQKQKTSDVIISKEPQYEEDGHGPTQEGMVLHKWAWSYTSGHGPTQVGMVLHKRAWSYTSRHGPTQVGMVLHNWAWSYTTGHGPTQVGMVLHKWAWSYTSGLPEDIRHTVLKQMDLNHNTAIQHLSHWITSNTTSKPTKAVTTTIWNKMIVLF